MYLLVGFHPVTKGNLFVAPSNQLQQSSHAATSRGNSGLS